MKFVTPYTPPEKRGDFSTKLYEESLAQESDMEDADINIIMKKYSGTGMLPAINMEALSGDFSDVGDFRDAQERIREANLAFADVPAALRRRFDNDPQKFIEFLNNPENRAELVKLGYIEEPEVKVAPPPPESQQEPKNGE